MLSGKIPMNISAYNRKTSMLYLQKQHRLQDVTGTYRTWEARHEAAKQTLEW